VREGEHFLRPGTSLELEVQNPQLDPEASYHLIQFSGWNGGLVVVGNERVYDSGGEPAFLQEDKG